MDGETYEENLKKFGELYDAMASCIHFGTTPDEFVARIESFFQDSFHHNIIDFVGMVKSNHPNISQDELLEKSASIFNGVLNLTTDSLFNYIQFAVFAVPNNIELEEFKKLHEAMKAYNPDEDARIEAEINSMQAEMTEKRAYVKALKDKLAELKGFENDLSELIEHHDSRQQIDKI